MDILGRYAQSWKKVGTNAKLVSFSTKIKGLIPIRIAKQDSIFEYDESSGCKVLRNDLLARAFLLNNKEE